MIKTQIIYQAGADGVCVHPAFEEEAEAMRRVGFMVGTEIYAEAEQILYRGCMSLFADRYPSYPRMIQDWDANRKTLYMSEFIPEIEDMTIPTFFVDSLNEQEVAVEVSKRGWDKAFIKSDAKSLFAFSETASIWPDTSIEQMKNHYEDCLFHGPYAVREFIDDIRIFYDEQRYWVLNGHAYHPSGVVPDFVQEAATRIFNFSGSHYFTIDVAGDYIVEVNPGESSDRGGDNPLDFFCGIFAKEFL